MKNSYYLGILQISCTIITLSNLADLAIEVAIFTCGYFIVYQLEKNETSRS